MEECIGLLSESSFGFSACLFLNTFPNFMCHIHGIRRETHNRVLLNEIQLFLHLWIYLLHQLIMQESLIG